MSELLTIALEVLDNSSLQMAYAICKHYKKINCENMENTIIDLEEIAEHINAYTKAEREMLEVKKKHERNKTS